jgi:hypothetical protein
LTNASCSRKNIPWFQLHQVSMISALTLSVPFIMWQSPWISQGACFSSENKSDQYDTMYFKDTMCGCVLHQFHETKIHDQTRRSIQSYYSYNAPINFCSYSLINAARLEETKQKQIYSIVLVRHHRRSNARSTAFEASTALTLSVPFIMWQSPWISQGACFSSENKSDQYDTMYKSNIVGSGIKHQIYINL